MAQTAEIIQLHERLPKVKADTDDGWHKIATTLARKECSADMSRSEWKVYNTVKLRTFGFRKSMDWIAAVQFEEETGIKANKISEIKQRLVDRNILKADGRKVGVNTVVSDWSEKPITPKQGYKTLPLNRVAITPIQDSFTPKQGNKYPETGVHNKKDNNNKIITKDIVRKPDANPDYIEIISHLNDKAGKAFKNTPANHKFIKGRINDGHSVADLKSVIDHKALEWGTDSKMCAYLRPATLFNATNFEGYLSVVGIMPNPSNGVTILNDQQPVTAQGKRAAITAALMDIGDTSW